LVLLCRRRCCLRADEVIANDLVFAALHGSAIGLSGH